MIALTGSGLSKTCDVSATAEQREEDGVSHVLDILTEPSAAPSRRPEELLGADVVPKMEQRGGPGTEGNRCKEEQREK